MKLEIIGADGKSRGFVEAVEGMETMRGKVTKVNSGILGKNWVHIQDGTEAEGNFDLTVTTQETAKVGDVVVVQGKITLNKDFGSGYKYDVIMEEAHCHAE